MKFPYKLVVRSMTPLLSPENRSPIALTIFLSLSLSSSSSAAVYHAIKIPDKFVDRPLYVIIEFGKEKFKTVEAEKGTAPVWIEECQL